MTDRREQRAAERILTDSSITDMMDDSVAREIIDWGVEVAKAIAQQTSDMDDAEADQFIDDKMQDVRRVIRRTNKLIGNLPASADEIREGIQRITEAAEKVPPVIVKAEEQSIEAPETPRGILKEVLSHFTIRKAIQLPTFINIHARDIHGTTKEKGAS